MSQIPSDLRYTSDHEWLRRRDGGIVEIGITDHAQAALGDLVFVELPEVGAKVSSGDACAVVESVKAAADVYAPLGGEIVEVNEELATAPERLNTDPYQGGWLMRLRPDDDTRLDALLDADAYRALLDEDG